MADPLPAWTLVRLSRFYTRISNPIALITRRFLATAAKVGIVARANGYCLDVGAGTAPYRTDLLKLLGRTRYVTIDVAPSDTTLVIADGCRMPFATGTFDLAVSFDVIQHVAKPERMIDEMVRAIMPGGHVLLTFAFLYPECDFRDFHRWTLEGMKQLLRDRGLEIMLAERRGGPCLVAACTLNWIMQHLIPGQRRSWRAASTWPNFLRVALVAMLTLPTTLLAWLALAVDHVLPPCGIYMGGAIVAWKPQGEVA